MDTRWLRHYGPGVRPHIDVAPYENLTAMLADSTRRYGAQTAFAYGGRNLTFAELDERVRQFAAYLQQVVQLRRGDRVALMMPNTLWYPVAWLGTVAAGCVAVNISPFAGQTEAAYRLYDSGAQLLVVADTVDGTLIPALQCPPVRHVLIAEDSQPIGFWGGRMSEWLKRYLEWQPKPAALDGTPTLKQALAAGQAQLHGFHAPPLQPGDLAALQYSDGVNGRAKAVEITHGNLLANVHQAAEWFKNTLKPGAETFAVMLPFYYLFSLSLNMLLGIRLGAQQVLVEHTHRTDVWLRTLGRYPVSVLFGINGLFAKLLQHPALADVDFGTWKAVVSGGMALERRIAAQWQRQTGTVITEAYGLTEAGPGVCAQPLHLAPRPGSVGVPLPNTLVEIRDTAGRALPPGAVGELWVKGPQVMRGYWMRPEESAAVLDGRDYLATGDMALMDTEGFIYIKGRRSDLIEIGGHTVYPDEVEHAVLELPGVWAAACVAATDASGAHTVKLYVVRADAAVDARTVAAHCRHRLHPHQQPAEIVFCERLPQSATGKLRRAELRRTVAEAV